MMQMTGNLTYLRVLNHVGRVQDVTQVQREGPEGRLNVEHTLCVRPAMLLMRHAQWGKEWREMRMQL